MSVRKRKWIKKKICYFDKQNCKWEHRIVYGPKNGLLRGLILAVIYNEG